MSLQNKRKKTKSKDKNELIITSKPLTIKTLNNTYTTVFDDIIQSMYQNNEFKDYSSFKNEKIIKTLKEYSKNIIIYERSFEETNIKKGKIQEFLFSNSKLLKFGNKNNLVQITENETTAINLSRMKNSLLRSSTGIYKNSFCFEIIPINDSSTNCIIGFSRIDANFNESNNYLGQTIKNESFGFDLNRNISCCNKHILNYGTYIHEGDIIGVLLDLINGRVEYFLNGKSLGACFTNIPNGENIAFFPSVTLTQNCGVIFNFGGNRKMEFYNCYGNSLFIDDILSTENNIFNITLEFVNILEKIVCFGNKVNLFIVDLMFSDVFIFLSQISFDDEYLIKNILFNFLIKDFENSIQIFLLIVKYSNDKIQFVCKILSILSQEIYYNSFGKKFEIWESLMNLFYNLISNDKIFNYWFNGKNYVENLIFIFKPYRLRIITKQNIENYYKNHKNEKYEKIFEKLRKQGIDNQKNLNLKTQNKLFKQIISFLMIRKGDKIKKQSLKKICNNFCQKMMSCNSSNEEYIWWVITFYFNLIDLLIEKNISIEKLSYKNFLNNEKNDYEYIGGSNKNVFQTFSKQIKNFDDIINKSPTLYSNMVELIIKIMSNFQFKIERIITRLQSLFDDNPVLNFEMINNSFYPLLIQNLYLFNYENNTILIKFLEFYYDLLNYMYLNKYIYFLPLDYIYIPFNIIKFLTIEQIIKKDENKNLFFKILELLLDLLNDKYINNPDIKEKLYLDIQLLISSSQTKFIFKNNTILKKLFINLSNIINNYEIKEIASNIIEKFFDIKSKYYEKDSEPTLVKKVIEFFKEERDIFLLVFENFNNELNRRLTNLIVSLNEYDVNEQNENQNFNIYFGENKIDMICEYFIYFNHTLPLYTFTFQNIPNNILNINNIEYTLFVNFMMNFTNRILDNTTINKFIPIIKHNIFLADRFKICFFCIIRLFFFFTKTNSKYYESFIKDFTERNEINFTNFGNIIKLTKVLNLDEDGNIIINNFENIYKELKQTIKKKNNNQMMTEKEWNNINNNENICILCYDRNITHHFIPCNHGGCLSCVKQYLIDKDYCFMCHSIIESIKEDKNIIINHKN